MLRLLFLLAVLLPVEAFADVSLEGRVFTEQGPLPGARVMLYDRHSDIAAGQPRAVSRETDGNGMYRMKAPSGDYVIVARGEQGGKAFFAYHGNNPIKLDKDGLWAALQAVEVPGPPVYEPGPTGVEGRLLFKGQPVDGAYVALYRPDSKTFKGLGLKTESADSTGRFSIAIATGKYVVIGKKMSSGKSNRPLQKGDLYCYYPPNPVEVRDGQVTRFDLSCYPKNDRDAFVTTPVVKDNELKTVAEQAVISGTGIRGRVMDVSGKPVEGMMVLAYRLASPVFMMYHVYHGTEYSALTDASGTTSYRSTRMATTGSSPGTSSATGRTGANCTGCTRGIRHAVTYKNGAMVENISITVGKVMEERPASKAAAGNTKPKVIGTPGGKPWSSATASSSGIRCGRGTSVSRESSPSGAARR